MQSLYAKFFDDNYYIKVYVRASQQTCEYIKVFYFIKAQEFLKQNSTKINLSICCYNRLISWFSLIKSYTSMRQWGNPYLPRQYIFHNICYYLDSKTDGLKQFYLYRQKHISRSLQGFWGFWSYRIVRRICNLLILCN